MHNDVWATCNFIGLGHFWYMLLLMVNVPHGLWIADQRYKQVVDHLFQLLKHGRPEDFPMFASLLYDMFIDEDYPDIPEEYITERWMFESLISDSPWTNNGAKTVRFRALLLHPSWQAGASVVAQKVVWICQYSH